MSERRGARATQRQRIVEAMIDVANRRGYGEATVSAVTSAAGVSKPAFYDYFEDRSDCFLACVAHAGERLQRVAAAALSEAQDGSPAQALIDALLGFAVGERELAFFLYAESMAGGRGALDARDRAVDNVGALLGAGADGQAEALDLPASAFAGALMRVLAMHLRRKEPALSRLAPGLRTWARRMSRPPERLRWTGPSRHAPARGRSPFVPTTGLEVMPEGLGRGRPTIGEEQVAANQQLRILSAVASLARTKGFTQTTVADINALAGVDNRVFYRLFSDKQDAFLALHALGLEYVIDATTRAFFSVDGWPERSWRAGQAFIDLLELDPLVEYIGFVEAYSVGPAAIQRIEESHTAFAVLMQEGLALGVPVERDVGRTMIELSIAAIFELVYRHARGAGGELSERLPDIAHLWLAPLIGLDRSDDFIDGALAARSAPAR